MFEPLQEPFMQRALAEMTMLALVGGALGCWIVLYEFSIVLAKVFGTPAEKLDAAAQGS